VEEYRGCGAYLTSSVVEIALGDGSVLHHDRVQLESRDAFHFCSLWAKLGCIANYYSTLVSTGAAISKQNPRATLMGEHAYLELNGLTMVGADQAAAPASQAGQAADTHSLIDHAMPNCISRQLQKFIVAGAARGVFNGRIIVRQGAQRTEASQSSRNLLLDASGVRCGAPDGGARMDAKPQLEIYADDVKCGHGATVGQLDAEALFYLQSRGLDPASARDLLLAGFAADVLNRLELPSMRRGLWQLP
jgi:Fe-S cluster assembly protein SufD